MDWTNLRIRFHVLLKHGEVGNFGFNCDNFSRRVNIGIVDRTQADICTCVNYSLRFKSEIEFIMPIKNNFLVDALIRGTEAQVQIFSVVFQSNVSRTPGCVMDDRGKNPANPKKPVAVCNLLSDSHKGLYKPGLQ